jgi:hypothetical protein
MRLLCRKGPPEDGDLLHQELVLFFQLAVLFGQLVDGFERIGGIYGCVLGGRRAVCGRGLGNASCT